MFYFQLLKDCGRKVTFRMTIWGEGELVLDKCEYTARITKFTTQYAEYTTEYRSKKGGIVVDVGGRSVVIRSTARIAQTK